MTLEMVAIRLYGALARAFPHRSSNSRSRDGE